MEDASRWADDLRKRNEETAERLVNVVIERLVFRFDRLKDTFAEMRAVKGNENLSNVLCFAGRLQEKLGYSGYRIVNKTLKRFLAIDTLSNYVFPKLKEAKVFDQVKYEAGILREVINFEIKRSKKEHMEMSLDADGISQIVDDFLILRDYHVGRANNWLRRTALRYGPVFLSPEERKSFDSMQVKPKEEVEKWLLPLVYPHIKPFVYFTYSLCRYLQEQENPLTPRDAYWLGAVDEIMGNKLPCLRQVVESQPEATVAQTPELPSQVKS